MAHAPVNLDPHESSIGADAREIPVFLGIARKAAWHGSGWDVLSASHVLRFPILPISLEGHYCLIGLNKNVVHSTDNCAFTIWLTEEDEPKMNWRMDVALDYCSKPEEALSGTVASQVIRLMPQISNLSSAYAESRTANKLDEPGAFEIMPLQIGALLVLRPTTFAVEAIWKGARHRLGKFLCSFVETPALSEEERRAIASSPGAASAFRVQLRCNCCGDELWVYAYLDPTKQAPQQDPPSSLSVEMAPDIWRCKCREAEVPLTYLKRGVYDLFRLRRKGEEAPLSYVPLYHRGEIADLYGHFLRLIDSSPCEEALQRFMEEHPIVWGFLSPAKILHKPAVLTKKQADFGVLSDQGILHLIEIEKPTTRLVTKRGSFSHELEAAVNQLRDWQAVVEEHRHALLDQLGLRDDEVRDVRYLLVAGLAANTDSKGLATLQRTPPMQKTMFYTFDELAAFLHNLQVQLAGL